MAEPVAPSPGAPNRGAASRSAPTRSAPAPSLLSGLVREARPRQWIKNLLVLAAPVAAGVLDGPMALGRALLAFVAFCLAASGTYYLNDLLDVTADRRHPVKRLRPIAAGIVPMPLARAVALVLLAGAVAVAGLVGGWQLPVIVVAYISLTTSYSLWLKHIAAVDLVAVAAGFVLRALAGAAAVGVPVSRWFFIVASLGSLSMVAGKRRAELRSLAGDAVGVRTTHGAYSTEYLASVQTMASGAVLVSYCLWAFERASQVPAAVPWSVVSIAPFALGVLRYALLVDKGAGEEPEEVVLRDRTLLVCGLVLTVLFALGNLP